MQHTVLCSCDPESLFLEKGFSARFSFDEEVTIGVEHMVQELKDLHVVLFATDKVLNPRKTDQDHRPLHLKCSFFLVKFCGPLILLQVCTAGITYPDQILDSSLSPAFYCQNCVISRIVCFSLQVRIMCVGE